MSAFLLSDLLLLTKEDENAILTVVHNPISLEYVLNIDCSTHRKYPYKNILSIATSELDIRKL